MLLTPKNPLKSPSGPIMDSCSFWYLAKSSIHTPLKHRQEGRGEGRGGRGGGEGKGGEERGGEGRAHH